MVDDSIVLKGSEDDNSFVLKGSEEDDSIDLEGFSASVKIILVVRIGGC